MFRRKPKLPPHVDWVIVGLGNPGAEYSGTRHNVGFEVIDRLAKKHDIKLDKSKHRSRFGVGTVVGEAVALAKPMTFMNLSGQSVAPLLRELNLKSDRLLVVADDTDLPVGKVKLKQRGSSGGHNGHKSLISSLGTQDYARIKLGIGRVHKDVTIDHVLGTFDRDERDDAEAMILDGIEAVEQFIKLGAERAMNIVNQAEPENDE